MDRKRYVAWGALFSFLALPAVLFAAGMDHDGMGHDGMSGMPADHGGMNMDMKSGELLFSGKVGPWTGEARLIEKQAYMEQSGVPAKFAARFAGERHLMMFLTDPMTGKPLSGAAGEVIIKGPGEAAFSKVTLVGMGAHIGADVTLPQPGEYTFTAEIESDGRKGSVTFSHTLK